MTRGDDKFVGVGDGDVINVADDTSDQKEPTMRRRMLSAQIRRIANTWERTAKHFAR
jgi:hypothetical protein